MNAANTPNVRRTGQRGYTSSHFPGWHVLGTGIGADAATAIVKSEADAVLYTAAPAMEAALERIAAARDNCAETGEYGEAAIDSGDQSFDDWAADVACEALTRARGA